KGAERDEPAAPDKELEKHHQAQPCIQSAHDLVLVLVHIRSEGSVVQAKQLAIARVACCNAGKVIKGPGGSVDQVLLDETRAFLGALRGILQAALPLQHRPAV